MAKVEDQCLKEAVMNQVEKDCSRNPLREQFEKHIHIDSLSHEDELNHAMAWAYIQWLESRLIKAEQEKKEMAWKVWRKQTGSRYIPMEDADKRNTKYFEQWYIKQGQ
jgi:hypothetical protein